MTPEQIANFLHARPIGLDRWQARCPGPLHAHGDRHPSLRISEGRDGRVLVKCFAGCKIESICAAAGLAMSDLFTERRIQRESTPPIVRTIERKITDMGLRSRLTPTERDALEPIVILTTIRNLDAAICRGLALTVEGDLCQIVLKEQQV
jgi:hypothetical protein